MKKIRLTKQEKAIENKIVKGEYIPASKAEINKIVRAIARRKKDTVLNIRINSEDLGNIKQKAKRVGIPYQTFIAEILHHYAD